MDKTKPLGNQGIEELLEGAQAYFSGLENKVQAIAQSKALSIDQAKKFEAYRQIARAYLESVGTGFSLLLKSQSRTFQAQNAMLEDVRFINEQIRNHRFTALREELEELRKSNKALRKRNEQLQNRVEKYYDTSEKKQRSYEERINHLINHPPAPLSNRIPRRFKPPVKFFAGRSAELAILKEKCTPPSKSPGVLIVGSPGTGKRELMLKFAQEHKEQFSVIWTIRCHSKEVRAEDYSKLALQLGIMTGKLSPSQIVEQVHSNLEFHERGKPWLILFDGVTGKVPFPCHRGYVVITSIVNPSWNTAYKVIALKPNETITQHLLRKVETSEARGELHRSLGGNLELVILAKRALKHRRLSIGNFLKNVKEKPDNHPMFSVRSSNNQSLYQRVLRELERLKCSCKPSWEFLRAISLFVGRKYIEHELFNFWLEANSYALEAVLPQLQALGWAHSVNGGFEVDPTVLKALHHQDPTGVEHAAVQFLSRSVQSCRAEDADTFGRFRVVYDHWIDLKPFCKEMAQLDSQIERLLAKLLVLLPLSGVNVFTEYVKICQVASKKQNKAAAWYNLGLCYEHGFGIAINLREAFQCYNKAADLRLQIARVQVAFCLQEGRGTEENSVKSKAIIKSFGGCCTGCLHDRPGNRLSAEELYILGWYFVRRKNEQGTLNDQGTRNLFAERASRYIEQAANKGCSEAQYKLGWHYAPESPYPPSNRELAIQWYKRAADQGHKVAQFELAYHYERLGRKADALRYYKLAAENGNSDALWLLGLCYYRGWRLVERDLEQCRVYLNCAAALGHTEAKELLDTIQSTLKKSLR